MSGSPIRLIAAGYGLAALAAAALHDATGAVGVSVMAFWLGGAVATLGLGAIVAHLRRPSATGRRAEEAEALAAAMAAWEAERLADAAQAARTQNLSALRG